MTKILETVVCSAKQGNEARLERMLSSRVEFRNRQDGCVRYLRMMNFYLFSKLFSIIGIQ